MTVEAIDLHSHLVPPGLLDVVEREGEAHDVRLDAGPRLGFGGRAGSKPIRPDLSDLEGRLRWMDAVGIELAVLSPWMGLAAYELRGTDARWFSSLLNDLTVRAIEARPDRFRAMAALPLGAPDLAARELRRAVEELGMVGAEIGTSVAGRELDHPALEPVWEEAERLNVPVLIHPHRSIGGDRLARYLLHNSVGNPAEETVAAMHLVAGGVLDRHPALRVILTHGGGFLPYQVGRQDRAASQAAAGAVASAPPTSYLGRFLYDSVVFQPEALRFLVEVVGADRVVLGSDAPFPMGDPDPVGTVRRANLGEGAERAVLRENAERELAAVGSGGAP